MPSKISTYLSITYIWILLLASSTSLYSQEINFGSYSSDYTISISELAEEDLFDFGILIQNGGISTIDLFNSKVLIIEGVKYLDVIITVIADEYLLLDGNGTCETDPNCRIKYTLAAAYANRGQNNISQAVPANITGNFASFQFPIKYRGDAPPGPPPTPVYEGYNPAIYNENAYIYLYGSINVGNVAAGDYSANIVVNINYD